MGMKRVGWGRGGWVGLDASLTANAHNRLQCILKSSFDDFTLQHYYNEK
jgi:hypothetical protein